MRVCLRKLVLQCPLDDCIAFQLPLVELMEGLIDEWMRLVLDFNDFLFLNCFQDSVAEALKSVSVKRQLLLEPFKPFFFGFLTTIEDLMPA